MDAIFINSGNSKTPDPHKVLLIFWINLKSGHKYVALSNHNIYYTLKNIKKSYKNNKLKYQCQHGMENLNCLMDHIQYQIFKILSPSCKHLFLINLLVSH